MIDFVFFVDFAKWIWMNSESAILQHASDALWHTYTLCNGYILFIFYYYFSVNLDEVINEIQTHGLTKYTGKVLLCLRFTEEN